MKKRRELNALVGKEKIRRKSTSTSGSLELLRYNGSESSDDDFRMSSSKTRDSGVCSSCASVLVFLLLVACMLICAGLTWMHVEMKKDMQILQHSLAAVEGKSLSSSEDMQQLFQQLSVVNKTAMQQGKMFSHLQLNISSVNDTLIKLSSIVDTLSYGLETAPELKELPAKLVAVSEALAALGSNVSGLKETVDLLSPSMKSVQTKLEALSTKFASLNQDTGMSTTAPQMSPDVVQQLTEQIQSINSTVSSQLSVLMKSATVVGEEIFQLEKKSQNLSNLIESIGSAQKLLNAVHAPVPDDFTSELFHSSVKAIMENMTDNLLGIEGSVTMAMLKTLENGLKMKVETMNTSLVELKSTVSHMTDLLVKQATQVTYMTKQIEATQHYIVQIESKLGNKVEVANSTTTNMLTLDSLVPSGINMSMSLTTALPADTVQSTVGTKTIQIPSIKKIQDLIINFHRWNNGNDGEVKYSVLPDFLGSDTPNEEDLKQFDEDHNGQYSLQEFAKALGIAVGTDSNRR